MTKVRQAELQREIHARRNQPEMRLFAELLALLLSDSKDALTRADVGSFTYEQGKANAYIKLINMIERPSPVQGHSTENKNV